MKKPFGFRPPKWYADKSIPIVGRQNSTDLDKLKIMIGNACEWIMQNHPEMTPERLKHILKTGEDRESDTEGSTGPRGTSISES